MRRYAERFDLQPRVFEIAPVNWATEEDYADIQNRTDPDPTSIPGDIEPLRCFYFGSINAEPAAACIQFYRVLEYYAFLASAPP